MANSFNLPESMVVTVALKPATDAAGRTGDYVRISKAHKTYIVANINQGAANTIALTLSKATAAAGSGATAVTELLPIWSCADVETSNVVTRQTDAASFTTSAATTVKTVIFEIAAGALGDTYDFVALVTGASSASNITSAVAIQVPLIAAAGGTNIMVD
jgi:hypothetical protein